MTGRPSGKPVAFAASLEIVDDATGDSVTSGIQERGISKAASISSDHRRFATSSNEVPEASETSVKNSPVNL